MVSSNTYNLLSHDSKEIVNMINQNGHHISLHFDPTCYKDIDTGFEIERKLFEEAFNKRIELISLHRPNNFLENNNRKMKGCDHTYEDKYFKEMIYLSDSGGADLINRFNKIKSQKINKPIHMLMHPIWWINKSDSPTNTLNNWLNSYNEYLISETARNCKTYNIIKNEKI